MEILTLFSNIQHYISKVFILAFLAFNVVQLCALHRATLNTKLFMSDFLVSRLTMFEIKKCHLNSTTKKRYYKMFYLL